jgi:hypothetical protein
MGTHAHMLPTYRREVLTLIAGGTAQSQVSPGLEPLRAYA